MTSYRDDQKMDEAVRGEMTRRLSTLVRRGTLSSYQANEVVDVLLAEFAGQTSSTDMSQCQPVGFVARAKDPSQVEVIVVGVASSDKHPVAVAAVDHARQAVIDAAGLTADESMMYTTERMAKINAAGEILLGLLEGNPAALALLADVQSLNERVSDLEGTYNTHVHTAMGTSAPVEPSTTSATIVGTDYIREQR